MRAMTTPEWFRRERWNRSDQMDFFVRLLQARPRNRAQYLRIQAVHLAAAGERDGALRLLDVLLTEYPEELEIAAAQHLRARCLDEDGRLSAAGEAFRASLSAMRTFPSARTDSHLDFALFALRHGRASEYEEALAVLDEFADQMIFPVQKLKYTTARALLLARMGTDPSAVRALARQVLEEGQSTTSGLAHHPDRSLARVVPGGFDAELRALSRGQATTKGEPSRG